MWFPRAVSVHGGLRVQRGRQWTSLSWWLCVCGRCLGAVGSHCERCEVNTKGNEVVAPCLTPVGVWRNRVCPISVLLPSCPLSCEWPWELKNMFTVFVVCVCVFFFIFFFFCFVGECTPYLTDWWLPLLELEKEMPISSSDDTQVVAHFRLGKLVR